MGVPGCVWVHGCVHAGTSVRACTCVRVLPARVCFYVCSHACFWGVHACRMCARVCARVCTCGCASTRVSLCVCARVCVLAPKGARGAAGASRPGSPPRVPVSPRGAEPDVGFRTPPTHPRDRSPGHLQTFPTRGTPTAAPSSPRQGLPRGHPREMGAVPGHPPPVPRSRGAAWPWPCALFCCHLVLAGHGATRPWPPAASTGGAHHAWPPATPMPPPGDGALGTPAPGSLILGRCR